MPQGIGIRWPMHWTNTVWIPNIESPFVYIITAKISLESYQEIPEKHLYWHCTEMLQSVFSSLKRVRQQQGLAMRHVLVQKFP